MLISQQLCAEGVRAAACKAERCQLLTCARHSTDTFPPPGPGDSGADPPFPRDAPHRRPCRWALPLRRRGTDQSPPRQHPTANHGASALGLAEASPQSSKMGVQVLLFLRVSWTNRGKEHSRLAARCLSCKMGRMRCFYLTETPWGWTRAVKVWLRSETHWHAASRNALFVPLLTPVHLLTREKDGTQDHGSLTFLIGFT